MYIWRTYEQLVDIKLSLYEYTIFQPNLDDDYAQETGVCSAPRFVNGDCIEFYRQVRLLQIAYIGYPGTLVNAV